MAKQTTEQGLANLIQAYKQVVACARSLYGDDTMKEWAIDHSNGAKERIQQAKQKLKDDLKIDYDSDEAKKQLIKEGSEVEVLVNHMDGMKGATAIVKGYSIPAMLSDITMSDGMKMPNHKWLTNNEVKLI